MKISDSALQRNKCDRIMTNPCDGMGGDTPAWNPDNWETPDAIAQLMAKLVKPSDRTILEPAAGSGQIAKYLPINPDVFVCCCEIDKQRFAKGLAIAPGYLHWVLGDFLQIAPSDKNDLIIGNPPFSLCLEFIERSLSLLNPRNSEARILFLLPGDWNASHKRGNYFRSLNAHIHHKYQIQGRVAFPKNGKPFNSRQIYDAVWDIRPGKSGGVVTYLDEV